MTLYKHELKENLKSLLIWTICVGGMCLCCILLYISMEDSIQGMEDSFASMGAFSQAMGMDKMSIATLIGYYATAVAVMHSLGGAMFAALTGSVIVSKEEAGHTAEFLNILPIGRKSIIIQKYLALVTLVVLFNVVCVLLYLLGFGIVNEEIPMKEFFLFHAAQLLMHLEIATISFAVSAFNKKNLVGVGLGVAIGLYAVDLICRIVPSIENLKYITPYYYSNASDIFTSGKVEPSMLVIAVAVVVVSFGAALYRYIHKDISA